MARRGRSRFVRPAARTKIWIGNGVGTTSIAGNAKVLVGVLAAGALLLRPFTILRTHMDLVMLSDQVLASESNSGSYGQIIVTDTATGIGATAVPDPSGTDGDPEADWYVWQALFNEFVIDINGTDGIGMLGDNGHHYAIDSKAMRKVGPDDDVALVVSNTTATGFNLVTNGRMLIQLH